MNISSLLTPMLAQVAKWQPKLLLNRWLYRIDRPVTIAVTEVDKSMDCLDLGVM